MGVVNWIGWDEGGTIHDVESVEEWAASVLGGGDKAVGGQMAYSASRQCEFECECGAESTLVHSDHRTQMGCSVLPPPSQSSGAQAFPSKTGSNSPCHCYTTTNIQKGKGMCMTFLPLLLLPLLLN